MKFSIIRYQSLAPSPWKNGAGTTCEVWRYPSTATLENFSVRCSVAEVKASGPFSLFPGYLRSICLLHGSSVELRSASFRQPIFLQPFRPFEFDGTIPIDCKVDATSLDLNLMIRSSEFRMVAEVLNFTLSSGISDIPQSLHVDAFSLSILFVMAGSARIQPPGTLTPEDLLALDAVVIDNLDSDTKFGLAWSATAGAVISCHRITRAANAQRSAR